MSAIEALRVIIGGRVQGVGFRYFTVEKARFHRLVGFVRNLPDGQVEALAIGRRPDLEALLEDLTRGSALSRVSQVSVSWSTEAPAGYVSFDVIH